jgi:NADP-dependent 3-hydroxy acid dehydrogenase YdfG
MSGFDKDLLQGRRVLITGGGTGLGKSMGERFLSLGAELVICGRRKEVLDQTAAEFRDRFGSDVQTVRCDVRSPDNVETMLDEIWRQAPLDVLVNNAAGNFVAQTHKLSARAIDSVLGICLHGTAYCTTGVGRRWIEQGRPGTVLSILTLSALQGGAFTVPSAMAKAGVDAMTKSLAVEWGQGYPSRRRGAGQLSDRRRDVAPERRRATNGSRCRLSLAAAWRSQRTREPLRVSGLRSRWLYHRRDGRDRWRPAIPGWRAGRGRRDAQLVGPGLGAPPGRDAVPPGGQSFRRSKLRLNTAPAASRLWRIRYRRATMDASPVVRRAADVEQRMI